MTAATLSAGISRAIEVTLEVMQPYINEICAETNPLTLKVLQAWTDFPRILLNFLVSRRPVYVDWIGSISTIKQ